QPERVAPGQYAFEQGACLLAPADRGQRVDVPEGTDGEAGLRYAEVVRRDIAEQAVPASQVPPDRLDGTDEPWIVGGDEAQVGQQQQRRIQPMSAEHVDEMAAAFVPSLGDDPRVHRVGALAPVLDAAGQ